MLGRMYRFHGHNGLSFVYKRGLTVRGDQCSIRTIENSKRPEYRVAVVVSKKVAKAAVTRNRIRRRIFEYVRRRSDGIAKPLDIVITVFASEMAEMPAAELEKTIEKLLVKSKVITKPTTKPRATIEQKES